MSELQGAVLMPRRKASEVKICVYSADFERFRKFLEALNSDLAEEGMFTEEDVFGFMLAKALEAYPKHKAKVLGLPVRGRKSKSDGIASEQA